MIQELQLLFPFDVCALLLLTELVSHLAQMFFHHSIAGKLLLIIHPFSKFDDISWINNTFILMIAQLSNSLKFGVKVLWIWIGHVMASHIRWSLTVCSGFGDWWGENWKFLSSLWSYHLSAICSKLTGRLTHIGFVFVWIVHWSPIHLATSGNHFSNLKN